MSPLFDLFKRKPRTDKPSKKTINTRLSAVSTKDGGVIDTSISIESCRDIIKKIEDNRIAILSDKIARIKNFTQKSLNNINNIIQELDNAKIDVTESSFESTVINSKKMVVSSIKKELHSELPTVSSLDDIFRFQERLESMLNRFLEVSASHKKIFNFFMSKYADRLKNEFETISSISHECKSEIKTFDTNRKPLKEFINNLDLLIQKKDLIKSNQSTFTQKKDTIKDLESQIYKLNDEINKLEQSERYQEAEKIIREKHSIAKDNENFHKELINTFSRVSRAFNKYSYGLNKTVLKRFEVMTEKPWEIFDDDIGIYLELMQKVKTSLSNGKITVKDSDKIETHIDNIINSLGIFKKRFDKLKDQSRLLSNSRSIAILTQIQDLKEQSSRSSQEIADITVALNELQLELEKTKSELRTLSASVEKDLMKLTGKKYRLSLVNNSIIE